MRADDFDHFCEVFGDRVRRLRVRRGLTQEDMMARGFSLRHYQRIESGRSVTLRTIWKLSRALNVRPRDLLPSFKRLSHEVLDPSRRSAMFAEAKQHRKSPIAESRKAKALRRTLR